MIATGASTIAMDLNDVWNRVLGGQPSPQWELVLIAGAVALLAVLPWRVWRITRNVVTIAHEGGHALVAVLTGRRLTGIQLHSDTSGLTLTKGRPRGPGMVLTAAAGYVTPSLLGLGVAALLGAGKITLLLWVTIVLLAAMLVMIRNAFGVLSVLVTGGIVFAVSWYAPSNIQAVFGYVFAWFLLLGGVRPVFELQRKRWRGRAPDSDADQLAKITGVAGGLWVTLFALVSIASLVIGSTLLLPALP
ncbi:M50 family metallopeptidase [Kutzneria buriramensis]|uniref:M50 family metallopeptidase n=1 Tax=Kutzneria buriramensis TaxID=1045776 RepID=UPI001FE9D868|nr:M50 family metallopeptidase [Kutzneria buriramensis]